MRKIFFVIALIFCAFVTEGHAQKYALIDTEYILGKIPQYVEANKSLEAEIQKKEAELQAEAQNLQNLIQKYQADQASLTPDARKQKESDLMQKQKTLQENQQKYFGQDGEFAKKHEQILTPYRDAIYEAVKEISLKSGYSMVIDRAAAQSIIFAMPDIDISDQVLSKMGYSK